MWFKALGWIVATICAIAILTFPGRKHPCVGMDVQLRAPTGTAEVNTTCAGRQSLIIIQRTQQSQEYGTLQATIHPGRGFTVQSSNPRETSIFRWIIIHEVETYPQATRVAAFGANTSSQRDAMSADL